MRSTLAQRHVRPHRLRLLALTATFGLSACAQPVIDPIDKEGEDPGVLAHFTVAEVAAQLDGASLGNIDGITKDPRTGEIHILTAGGVTTLDPEDGEVLAHYPSRAFFEDPWAPQEPEDDGETFPDPGFTDIASLGDGQFALTLPWEVRQLDVASRTVSEFFCLVPAPIDGPIIERHNDAVTVDLASDRILAAPISIDQNGGDVLDNPLVRYRAHDGELLGAADLSQHGVVAGGAAFERSTETLLLFEGARVLGVSLEGEARFDVELGEVENAEGATIDHERGLLYVADAADFEVRVFDLADLLP